MPSEYGPGGKWIHDRAHGIMEDGKTPKSVAYAVATQQAHKVGKSPKDFRTPHGVHEAKQKYDEPKSEYQKTASEKERRKRLAKARFYGGLAGLGAGTAGASLGVHGLQKIKAIRNLSEGGKGAIGALLGTLGAAGGMVGGISVGESISKARQRKEMDKKAMLIGFFDELQKLAENPGIPSGLGGKDIPGALKSSDMPGSNPMAGSASGGSGGFFGQAFQAAGGSGSPVPASSPPPAGTAASRALDSQNAAKTVNSGTQLGAAKPMSASDLGI